MPPRGGYWNGEIGVAPQECHCGTGGHPLGSVNCPVHGYFTVKRRRPKLVDPKSYDLACHFLSDCPKANEGDRTELAAQIQEVCEDYCQTVEQEHGPDHG